MTLDLKAEPMQHIEFVSDEALDQMDRIADKAKSKLQGGSTVGSDSFASVNTLMGTDAIQNLEQISAANRESFQTLVKEPAIARVVAEDEDGHRQTYYICRAAALSGFLNHTGYLTEKGRLAALPVGEELELKDGSYLTVIERTRLYPTLSADGWDSLNTVFETDEFSPTTVKSIRALFVRTIGEEATEDLLSQLLADESLKDNIVEGLRRSVITKMGLRDQPILDQYQDEIFRLPLDQRLLIIGPPGTGKTTTLIRRLGQKLDTAFLDESEQRLVDTVASKQGAAHAHSWLMFTPTVLLKQYLKEAFAREGVAAPDPNIKTWRDYQRELARNTFGVLRGTSGSGFILRENLNNLQQPAIEQPIQWFNEFNTWQLNTFVQELRDAAKQLIGTQLSDVNRLGSRLQDIVSKEAEGSMAAMLSMLVQEIPKIQNIVSQLKEVSDKKIKGSLNRQLNSDKSFITNLGVLVDSLQQQANAGEFDEDPDEEEEEVLTQKTPIEKIVAAYNAAVSAHAKATASKRALSKNSRNGKIIEWLGERGLMQAESVEVGASLLIQTSARRFVNPVKRYLDGIPKRYRSFRRESQPANRWYQEGSFDARDIHPLELDIVLLASLRAAWELLSRPNVQRDIDEPAWSALKPIFGHYRNQILVDEATDFSPVQLASMAALTHPQLRSFFACGDFNQRLTTWGARSVDELKWVFPDIDIKEVLITYRQSQQLNDLAHAMIRVMGGNEQHASLPAHMDNTGVAPALLEDAGTTDSVVNWLADRIREIEQFVGELPSTAIFVNSESEVSPVAAALDQVLAEHNIQVVACHEGQAVGQESSVRVFDIQHIKGLEFEAVFFIGIDQLAAEQPALFDKYLYVGTTRAATYLGITCQEKLPSAIDSLRSHFCQDWQ
ncbi:ATP-binding domain-containing protein [Shewanella xiamenensis]|uniref:ATP-binding domain-containing protein n=1 Tax=Shewanella xiamenensis TaxID=332186 RepID=UPI001C4F0C33|nr:ATP-binding domain-containing protein [Shewanella xiamenensis]MBW0281489.1 DNA helicase UvrD [Shewanella xiamenensis]MCT8872138.1 ATP-dependent helicase [Shewanella xiamenensis]UWH40046.1 ATP-dependent helicase [Shewanella xiamenensis]